MILEGESMEETNKIAVFEGKDIRRTWFNNEWWFVVEDIVFALTDSNDPKQYINKMKQRDAPLSQGWVQIVHTLSIDTKGGKQNMNCVNTQGAFRIIQSIPSPKAEPFKAWLAKVGYERVKEIENPELAQIRMKEIYRAKGYSKDWIEKRIMGIEVREKLTKEWKDRGVKEGVEYAILTNEISKATFDITPKQHKELKGLKKENVRDHMNHLELIFTMLGESATTEIAKAKNAQGFEKNKDAAIKGGTIAGDARKKLEVETGKKVLTTNNYLQEPEKEIRKRLKK